MGILRRTKKHIGSQISQKCILYNKFNDQLIHQLSLSNQQPPHNAQVQRRNNWDSQIKAPFVMQEWKEGRNNWDISNQANQAISRRMNPEPVWK
jgi:hypothetical protein